MAKPTLLELIESTGRSIDDWFYDEENPEYEENQRVLNSAIKVLYNDVGANIDARNWDEIMSSGNVIESANSALAAMYSDPAYREMNTAYLTKKDADGNQRYDPAQLYLTYGQMVDRVGADYTPSTDEIAAVESYFDRTGSPGEFWNLNALGSRNNFRTNPNSNIIPLTGINAGNAANTNTSTGAGGNTGAGSNAGVNTGAGGNFGANTFNYSPVTTGQYSGGVLGSDNVRYQSDLIKSLRESDSSLLSQNPGFTQYGYTPPSTSGGDDVSLNAGGAFNPEVLNQDVASAEDVANWNNYSTYRTNALNAKTPITSFEEWLAGGKVSGIPEPVVEAPVYNYDGGGG